MSRPKGSRTTRETAVAVASRCPNCQSTDLERIGRRTLQPFAGVDSAGQPFTAIARQRVRCANCGQCRIDRTLTYEGQPQPDQDLTQDSAE